MDDEDVEKISQAVATRSGMNYIAPGIEKSDRPALSQRSLKEFVVADVNIVAISIKNSGFYRMSRKLYPVNISLKVAKHGTVIRKQPGVPIEV